MQCPIYKRLSNTINFYYGFRPNICVITLKIENQSSNKITHIEQVSSS